MTIVSNVPPELVALSQWVLWHYETRDDGTATKVPHTCAGYLAKSTDPKTWSSFENACAAAQRPNFAEGIGFVFSAEDPYCGIDLDNVWRSDADEGASWAVRILEGFRDTYLEESPSSHGVKIWCKARSPRCGKWPVESGRIEIYDRTHFFTVTGRSSEVRVITDHQGDIERLITNLDVLKRRSLVRVPSSKHNAVVIPAGMIPTGSRHDTLVSFAGTMFRRGMPAEAIEAALLEVNRLQCDPPRTSEHIRQIVNSMGSWAR